ncbi:hypothetical protein [Streptomyces sp. MMS20-AI2-20]|uniref:hypothetical protein n=1 Tax=Streptomyces sp. MMS20-AI2-20 TaxID=2925835 RepID=UPI001F623B3E|nr:hypothetical protein [Streptomyces sp. MMS20-AI2-20]MCI4143041.1 hypothetical protein [Streptomyces sp. MMS20-AI2-20]
MRVWLAVFTGSSAICRGIAAWIAGAPTLRLVAVVVAGGFLRGWPGWDVAVPAAAVVWLIVAVVMGLRMPNPLAPAPVDEGKATADEDDQDADEDTPDEDAAAAGGIPRERLVRALHEVGAPHAHISALAEHLGAPTTAVREALAAARIPTSGGVRMKGRPVAVSPGVKAGDFPPLPSPTEEGPEEGALTSNNNDNNNGGRDFVCVPDDTNPALTHVRWLRRR